MLQAIEKMLDKMSNSNFLSAFTVEVHIQILKQEIGAMAFMSLSASVNSISSFPSPNANGEKPFGWTLP